MPGFESYALASALSDDDLLLVLDDPAGTKVTKRAPASLLRSYATSRLAVNVKEAPYSATGNGTTDDTTAFHAARDAAGVNGKVYVPAGTYRVLRVDLNVAGQVWEFHPAATLTMVGTVSGDWMLRVSANDVTVTGGTMDFTGAYSGIQNSLPVSAVDGVTWRGVTVKNTPLNAYSLVYYQCNRVRVQDCRFINCHSGAILVNNAGMTQVSYDAIITNNFIDNSTGSVANDTCGGIGVNGASNTYPMTHVLRRTIPARLQLQRQRRRRLQHQHDVPELRQRRDRRQRGPQLLLCGDRDTSDGQEHRRHRQRT
jgi:hypothetical protein